MRYKLLLLLILTLLTLSACDLKTDTEVLLENQMKHYVQEVIHTRLQNIPYEEQAQKFEDSLRTQMTYEVWEQYFDTQYGQVQAQLAVAEYYGLVAREAQLKRIHMQKEDEVYRYLAIVDLHAAPPLTDKNNRSMDEVVRLFYSFTFNAEGVLIAFEVQHKKVGDVGA